MQQKKCIISIGTGGFGRGIDRLRESLKDFDGDLMLQKDLPANFPSNEEVPYGFKCYAFWEAIYLGYTEILWVDSSFYAVNSVEPIFDIIREQGYYFVSNGLNCAQECNDNCLNYFRLTRDEAEDIPMISAGIIGLNIMNLKGLSFLLEWRKALNYGIFKGNRSHDIRDSADWRFLHHRHDQSAASCIIHKSTLKIEPLGDKVQYYGQNIKDSVIFLIHGGF